MKRFNVTEVINRIAILLLLATSTVYHLYQVFQAKESPHVHTKIDSIKKSIHATALLPNANPAFILSK